MTEQKRCYQILLTLGAIILLIISARSLTEVRVTSKSSSPASANRLPATQVIVLPTSEAPSGENPSRQAFDSLVAFTWNNLVIRTFRTDELMVVQLSQATCYACHPEKKQHCLYDILPRLSKECIHPPYEIARQGDNAALLWDSLTTCSHCHIQALTRSTTTMGNLWTHSMDKTEPATDLSKLVSAAHSRTLVKCTACHTDYPTIPAWQPSID